MKIIPIILTTLILFLFTKNLYFYKWIGYERIPNTTIFDEHDYPFAGYTFRKTGIPTGWSTMGAYPYLDNQKPNPKLYFDGLNINLENEKPSLSNIKKFNYPVTTVTDVDIGKGTETITLVQPFLDHPIFGSWLFSLGIKNDPKTFDQISPADYRQISLYLAVITGILIYIFSQVLFGNHLVSFFAFTIYSVVPEFILMSRYALLENVLIPLSLASFSLILISFKQKFINTRNFLLFIAGILSGIAFITKESGIFIIITSLIFLLSKKPKTTNLISFLVPIFILTASYYIYMYYLSSDLFFKLLFDQANRQWFGPLSYFSSFNQPHFSGFPKNSHWLFGTISLFLLAFSKPKKYLKLYLPYLIYLLVFLFMGGLNYPWYYLPLLPFIVIASAVVTYQVLFKPKIISVAIFYLFPFLSAFYWGYYVLHHDVSNYIVFRLSLVIFTLVFLLQYFKITRYSKLLWFLFISFTLCKMYTWNQRGLLFIIENWNSLPANFSFTI